ncbi:hypothetical protein MVEN_01787700 [Mycena venus]|uniref:Uncharacterized protein n=1 Tax=Mycena venus TaxID=2733690 RepID=A0A8H6XKI5_9AGAR|nr:hypothetical protein MVEN_01787700 [Mycena venus]
MAASLPPTGIPPDILKEVIDQVRNTRTSRTCELAFVSLYLYDYVTTLDQEANRTDVVQADVLHEDPVLSHIFLSQPCQCLDLSEHESNDSDFIVPETEENPADVQRCDHWFKFQSGEAIVTLGIMQAILVTRIWAIYNSTPLLITLNIFGGLQLAASSIIMGISITGGIATSQPGRGFFVCDITTPPYFAAYWIPILMFEFTLFLLIVIKGFQKFHRSRVFSVSGMSGQGLLNIMVRDSVIYFFIIAAIYAATAAVWFWTDPSLYQSLSVVGIMVPPMVASKMLFSLRQSFYEETTKSALGHELRFASPPSSSWSQHTRQTRSLHEERGQREEWGGAQPETSV